MTTRVNTKKHAKKAIWISFDLGLKGDYSSLYTWLDNYSAVECGNGLAFFNYNTSSMSNTEDLIKSLSESLKATVKLSKSDRVYVIWKHSSGKMKGKFLNGRRRQAPWEGYGEIDRDDNIADAGD
jgi:hypothetical protein